MAILGLDLGSKRVGMAISLSGFLAQTYKTIEYKDEEELFLELKKIVEKEKIEIIIVGLPISFSRKNNSQLKKIQKLAKQIKNKLNIGIIFEDESLTSKIAEKNLSYQKKAKRDIDAESARIILESYLEKK